MNKVALVCPSFFAHLLGSEANFSNSLFLKYICITRELTAYTWCYPNTQSYRKFPSGSLAMRKIFRRAPPPTMAEGRGGQPFYSADAATWREARPARAPRGGRYFSPSSHTFLIAARSRHGREVQRERKYGASPRDRQRRPTKSARPHARRREARARINPTMRRKPITATSRREQSTKCLVTAKVAKAGRPRKAHPARHDGTRSAPPARRREAR